MKKATVIIPTTGSKTLITAIDSVVTQSYKNVEAYVVIDGPEYEEKSRALIYQTLSDATNCTIATIPVNVGANGYYGHRIYAGFTHLIDSEYVLYLDQDCWFDENHIESLVETIEKNDYYWAYSLRKIVDKEGNYICNDDCESLGKWNPVMGYSHVDTNCYCIKTEIAIKICQIWHGGWGTDRIFYNAISTNFKQFNCSGKYTLNYRLDGNDGSVRPEFFTFWNEKVFELYGGSFPWRK